MPKVMFGGVINPSVSKKRPELSSQSTRSPVAVLYFSSPEWENKS